MELFLYSWQQSLSVGYELGSSSLTADENLHLYGAAAGQKMRGYNLLAEAFWMEAPARDFLSVKEIYVREVGGWDHGFLNDLKEFKGRPYTLERATLIMAKVLRQKIPLSKFRIEQGRWSCETSELSGFDELSLAYQTRFQSAMRDGERIKPIDLVMTAFWSGSMDEKTGIFWPWSQLKQTLIEAQRRLSSQPQSFFERRHPQGLESFLQEVFSLLTKNSAPKSRVRSVRFWDPLTRESWTF